MYVNKFPDVFELPKRNATIWRYMDLAKFESMLDTRALFFCRSDRFDDPFEGSYPNEAAVEAALPSMIAALASDPSLPQRIAGAKRMSSCRKQTREAVLVNCWHVNEHESEAMWKLYLRSGKGISIKSSVERLTDAVRCNEEVYLGTVKYRDYDRGGFPSMNLFHPFMSKRKSFEHEQELRAVIWDEDRFAGVSGNWPVHKRDCGMNASADLDRLIEEVRLQPGAPPGFRHAIESVCTRWCLRKEIVDSRLDALPVF